MKTIPKALAFVVGAFVAFVCGGTNHAADPGGHGPPPPANSIVLHPENRTVQVGAFVGFAITIHPTNEYNVTFQWRFNGQPINKPEAKKRTYFIDHVSVADVGAYSVEVKWTNKPAIISSNGYLSVYTVKHTNGTGGSLTISAMQFDTGSWSCAKYPKVMFNRSYGPADSGGNPFCFFGPLIPLASQYGPFVNWTHNNNVKIDLSSNNNEGVSTGLKFSHSTGGGGHSTEVDCIATEDSKSELAVNFTLSKDTRVMKASYPITVFYQTPAPPSGTIVLNWHYFD